MPGCGRARMERPPGPARPCSTSASGPWRKSAAEYGSANDPRELLELERPLPGGRVVEAAPEDDEPVAPAAWAAATAARLGLDLERLGERAGDGRERGLAAVAGVESAIERRHEQRDRQRARRCTSWWRRRRARGRRQVDDVLGRRRRAPSRIVGDGDRRLRPGGGPPSTTATMSGDAPDWLMPMTSERSSRGSHPVEGARSTAPRARPAGDAWRRTGTARRSRRGREVPRAAITTWLDVRRARGGGRPADDRPRLARSRSRATTAGCSRISSRRLTATLDLRLASPDDRPPASRHRRTTGGSSAEQDVRERLERGRQDASRCARWVRDAGIGREVERRPQGDGHDRRARAEERLDELRPGRGPIAALSCRRRRGRRRARGPRRRRSRRSSGAARRRAPRPADDGGGAPRQGRARRSTTCRPGSGRSGCGMIASTRASAGEPERQHAGIVADERDRPLGELARRAPVCCPPTIGQIGRRDGRAHRRAKAALRRSTRPAERARPVGVEQATRGGMSKAAFDPLPGGSGRARRAGGRRRPGGRR